MANTPTPRPPLPFGGEAEYNKALAGIETGVRPVSPEQIESVTQLSDLLGAQLRSELALRGDLGAQDDRIRTQGAETAEVKSNRTRTPFVLTCQEWLSQKDPRYLIASVNPSEIGWSLPVRAGEQKTRSGQIIHYWRDRFRGTFFDEPQLSITFQSGNIMPIRTLPLIDKVKTLSRPVRAPDPSEREPRVPPGLNNFYEFLALVDTQKILDDGSTNLCYIIYNSRLFPNLTLAGLFTPAGVTWSDSAGEPNQVNSWTATFTVYDSFPRLNDPANLVQIFKRAGWGRV